MSDDERHALSHESDSVSISALDKTATRALLSRVEFWLTLIEHRRRVRGDICELTGE